MTDWLPIVGIALTGIFVTMALAGRALQSVPAGGAPDLRRARIAFWVTVAATAATYALYLVFDESWLWYA